MASSPNKAKENVAKHRRFQNAWGGPCQDKGPLASEVQGIRAMVGLGGSYWPQCSGMTCWFSEKGITGRFNADLNHARSTVYFGEEGYMSAIFGR